MELKPGFQKTDVGVIPDDWNLVRLGDLVDSNRLIRYGVVQPGQFDASGCIMLRSQDYSKGWCSSDSTFRVSRSLANQYRNARLQSGDLIVTVVGAGTGQVEVAPEWLDGAVLSRSTARVAINEQKADRIFCRYILQSPFGQSQIRNQIKEGAQPVVSCPDMARFWIPLPPTPAEQRAIAGALSDVDALIGALDQLIAKKRDLKQAAMQQLLTGHQRLPGFAPANPRFTQTDVGMIPEDWNATSLGDIASLYQPVTISAKAFTATGYPVYGANGVVGCYHDFNHDTWQITVTCRGSTCGTVNRTVEKCWITGNAMVVNCDHNKEIDKPFLYYLLQRQDLSVCITGTGQPQIVRSPLAKFSLPVPSQIAEQTAIAEVLSDMDAELAALEQKRDKTRLLKQGMMQELLTGRTRLI